MRSNVWEQYQKYYVAFQFERAGLFKLIQEHFSCVEVLYPGCSYHITPSFYFPHLVYVDQSHAAATFFADHAAVLEVINRHKTYKRSPFIQFIGQNYGEPLPLKQESFDLLLALYAGAIVQPCTPYLKRGGLLLTNNHQADAQHAAAHPDLTFVAAIEYRAGAYILNTTPQASFNTGRGRKSKPRAMEQTSRGLLYRESATYYLFQRR